MSDNDLMPFGKHKGVAMANVPASWLVWFWDKNFYHYENGTGGLNMQGRGIMDYIKETGIDYLRKEAKND